MLRAFWQSVVWSESGLEFPLLLPAIVIFSEIFTPPFLCKAKPAALQLPTLPSAGKNSLFVFMSIDSSWKHIVMITKQYSWDHRSALKTCKRGCELVLWKLPVGMQNCLSKSQPWSITAPSASTCRMDKQPFRKPCHFKDMTAWVSLTMLQDRNTMVAMNSAQPLLCLLQALTRAPRLSTHLLFCLMMFSFLVNSKNYFFKCDPLNILNLPKRTLFNWRVITCSVNTPTSI